MRIRSSDDVQPFDADDFEPAFWSDLDQLELFADAADDSSEPTFH